MRRRLAFSDAFALVLERHRTAKKLSRQALAQKAGLHQTYIGMIERKLSNPSLEAANAIAEALELPLSKLIRQTEVERQKAELDQPRRARQEATARKSPASANSKPPTRKKHSAG
jgi:transcriptional regulator with XRE-family HTH domain